MSKKDLQRKLDYNPINSDNPDLNPRGFIDNRMTSQDAVWRQSYADMMLGEYNYLLDDEWYRTHESAGAKFDEYAALGMNPLDINRMLLGNPSYDSGSSSPSVSATGYEDETAMSQLLGSFANIYQTNINDAVAKAQIDNLRSQTAVNNATAPTIAPESQSRQAKNYSGAAKDYSDVDVNHAEIGVLNETQQKIVAERNLTETEQKQIEQVMSRYDEVTDAQITNWQSQSHLYFEQAKTQQNVRENIDADTQLKQAQELTEYQQSYKLEQETEGIKSENVEKKTIADFVSTNGIPLNAPDLQTLSYYENRGELDKAQNYLDAVFDCAANREAGVTSGQPRSVQVGALGQFRFSNNPRNVGLSPNGDFFYHPRPTSRYSFQPFHRNP